MQKHIKSHDDFIMLDNLYFSSEEKEKMQNHEKPHSQNSIKGSEENEDHPNSHIQSQNQNNEQIKEGQSGRRQRYARKRISHKSKRTRKIRKTITKEMIDQMNERFVRYREQKELKVHPSLTLRNIANLMSLGYSTILTKYRQFQKNDRVKEGVLLKVNSKRKYQKSKNIEEIIMQSFKQKKFYTAVQLAQYINSKYQVKCTRSMISRHLNELCFKRQVDVEEVNNLPLQDSEDEIAKRCAKCIIYGVLKQFKKIVYFGEYTIQFQRGKSLYILLLCGPEGMTFMLYNQPPNRYNFKIFVKNIINRYLLEYKVKVYSQWMFVTGMEEVFRGQTASYLMRQEEAKLIPVLDNVYAKLICYPCGARELNPMHEVYQKLLTKTSGCTFDQNTALRVKLWMEQLKMQAVLIVRRFELNIRKQFQRE